MEQSVGLIDTLIDLQIAEILAHGSFPKKWVF